MRHTGRMEGTGDDQAAGGGCRSIWQHWRSLLYLFIHEPKAELMRHGLYKDAAER